MGLIALSIILSVVLGSCIWLVLGDKFPLREDYKWPFASNIFVYTAILFLPIYLTIFTLF